MRLPETTIAIFSRAPVPGATKTRLIPRLGAEGAARLHGFLLDRILGEAAAATLGPVELWATDPHDAALRRLAARHGATIQAQGEGDLGARMARAFRPNVPVILVGSDCPGLGRGRLAEAASALAAHNLVLNPAEDGGYVLIAAKGPHPSLFTGMAWSTDTVAAETLRRAQAAGLRVATLDPLWDVDEPDDVTRLFESARELGLRLPDL